MSSTNLEKVIAEVKALTPDEQRQVKVLIDSLLQQSQARTPEELLNQRLLAAGVITRIPPRAADSTRPKFKPIEVKGKPVSETIIEERR